MRDSNPETDHKYDVWHTAKCTDYIHTKIFTLFSFVSFRKKVEQLSKKKDCDDAGKWLKSMVNHMYWCAASTEDGDGEVLEAKWLSLINHMHDKYSGHGENFPNCAHGQLSKRKWIKPRKYDLCLFQFLPV